MRAFCCDPIPGPGQELQLAAAEAFHAVRVLRARPGDRCRLLDGHGTTAEAEILAAGHQGRTEMARLRILARQCWRPPACRLRVCIAPPRAKLWNQLLKDLTELGVGQITPLLCEFSIARPNAHAASHWLDDLHTGMKQSGNPFLPQLDPPRTFAAALEALAATPGVFGDLAADAPPFAFPQPAPAEFTLWIGPEGGFSPAERQALRQAGIAPLRLGNWILRVETAAPALLGFLLGSAPDAFRSHPDAG
ncbi:MAG: RsmE family RNA methyltransferase [Lentisphaeria bacterium]|jgi:16S rRNA (uracil1498-N3)-methyltransferase